jgi:hypothetical protein
MRCLVFLALEVFVESWFPLKAAAVGLLDLPYCDDNTKHTDHADIWI